jgi:hypothetical protein
MECYTACNNAFFPQMECTYQDDLNFYYKWNHYHKLYLYRRPTKEDFRRTISEDGVAYESGAPAVYDTDDYLKAKQDYERCKGYILDYQTYPMAAGEPNR